MRERVRALRGSRGHRGFTLVELLVVIGIIAVLISILLPALSKARDASSTIKCASNLRSVGQGLAAYAAENKQYLPTAFNYRGWSITQDSTGKFVQTPTGPTYGIVHWSSYLLGSVPPEAFQCPAVANGGLPAQEPPAGGFDPGQNIDSSATASGPGVASSDGRVQSISATDGTGAAISYFPDSSAPRIAYTLNEALAGLNKYVVGFSDAATVRTYHNVSLSEVDNPSQTILATEWVDEWGIVSGVNRGSAGGKNTPKPHRPVNPWRIDGSSAGDADKDPSAVAYLPDIPVTTKLRKSNATDLWHVSATSETSYKNPNTGAYQSFDLIADYKAGNYSPASRASRLDFVGRNHGHAEKPADNKTNFLYLDGHVETKSILDTVPVDGSHATPWEWGSKPWAVSPNDLAKPDGTNTASTAGQGN